MPETKMFKLDGDKGIETFNPFHYRCPDCGADGHLTLNTDPLTDGARTGCISDE